MLPNRIKILRTLKVLNQKEMAELLHKSQSSYSRMENGEITITTDELKDIANILGCSTEELLKEQGIINILQHNEKAAARDYNEHNNDIKQITEQFQSIIQMIFEHQKNMTTDMKSFMSASQQQINTLIKEFRTSLNKD